MSSILQNGNGARTHSDARAPVHPLFNSPPPPVDQVAVEERAAQLAKRSIKKSAKVAGLRLAVRMMDLTTLEGKDTPGKVRALCNKALLPLDKDPTIGPCAAICVYPNLVPVAKHALSGSGVKVASVATSFPSGQSPLSVKLDDTRRAVELGADEIDMVIDRGAMLSGDYAKVFDEIAATKEASGTELVTKQASFARQGVRDAIANVRELAQMEAKSRKEAWKVVQERFEENLASLKKLLQPK